VRFTAEDVVDRLADAGVRLDRGLTEADVKRIEKKYAFTFGPDHRDLLSAALPLGDTWLNWRHATPANIRERLQRPIEAVLANVHQRDFWPASWGSRPAQTKAAETLARERLARVPALLPIYGSRYLPAAPVPAGCPVFSVAIGTGIGTDVGTQAGISVYANDLLGYVDSEFGFDVEARTDSTDPTYVPFWSDLAQGAQSADL
jgi:hypothetical protein